MIKRKKPGETPKTVLSETQRDPSRRSDLNLRAEIGGMQDLWAAR